MVPVDPADLRRRRRAAGLRKVDLGVSHPVVTRAERGEAIRDLSAGRIAKALGVGLDDLFRDEDAPAEVAS